MSDITEKEEAMLRMRLEEGEAKLRLHLKTPDELLQRLQEGERRWNAAETTFRMHQKTPPMADTWDDVAERRAAVEAARIAVLESPAAMAERHRAQGTQPEQTLAGVWHGLAELDRRLDAMERRLTVPTVTVHHPDEATERQFIAHGARLERAEIASLIRARASKATGRGQNRLKAELHLIAKLIEERGR